MEKEAICYGELMPINDGVRARIPAIVIIQKDVGAPNSLPETAEETIAALKRRLSFAHGSLDSRQLIEEEDILVLTAQVCTVDDTLLNELAGRLNRAAIQYVDHAVAAGFGLEGVLVPKDAWTKNRKNEEKANDPAGI